MSSSPAAATNITACGTFGAGSYTVINNITSVGITCLTFSAGPVTLDLNGYTVRGTGSTNGVLANAIANVTVRNGSIQGFARDIWATGAGAVIDGVSGTSGKLNGFTVGDNATVKNSLVSGHSNGGIVAGKIATIVGNTISGTAGNLIAVSDGSLVKGNTMTQNSTAGGVSIVISQTCKVLDNVISAGPGHPAAGVSAGDHNLISGNTINGFQTGILAGGDNVITGNNSLGNASGIRCDFSCLVSGNTAGEPFFETPCPGPVGIGAGGGSQVLNNVANGSCTGLEITCPSKVADNIAVSNATANLSESGVGCLTTGNLAP